MAGMAGVMAWVWGVAVLAGVAPAQDPPSPAPADGEAARPAARLRTDANGWPVLPPPGSEEAGRGRSEAGATSRPSGPGGRANPGTEEDPGRERARPQAARAAAAPATDLGSPLLDVLRAVGSVADWRDMRCVVARIRVHVFDHRGAEVGVREILHEADVRVARRDRLVFEAERKVYGRDGSGAWVELHGMAWPSLEDEAAEELELLGLLLRLPWALADGRRWSVLAEEQILVGGEPRVRIRVLPRADEDGLVGPEPAPPPGLRLELLCDPATMRPLEVQYTRHEGAVPRRLLLHDYRPFGALRLPVRRTLVGPRGRPRLELEIVRIDGKLDLPRRQFRP